MGLIVLTSSRNASTRMRQFLNELELVIPNAIKVNRGKSSIIEIAGKALGLGANKILYIGSRGGNPSFMRFLRVREGVIELMPYLIRIFGVKLLIDMPIGIVNRRRARNGVIISLREYTEVMDVLSEQLELPSARVYDFDSIRGMYDVIFLIHRVGNEYELQILNGRDLGPYGPFLRISDVIYMKPRVIRVG